MNAFIASLLWVAFAVLVAVPKEFLDAILNWSVHGLAVQFIHEIHGVFIAALIVLDALIAVVFLRDDGVKQGVNRIVLPLLFLIFIAAIVLIVWKTYPNFADDYIVALAIFSFCVLIWFRMATYHVSIRAEPVLPHVPAHAPPSASAVAMESHGDPAHES